jgi:hypothetical protein
LSRLGVCGRHLPIKIAAPVKQGSAYHRKFSKAHTGPRFAHSFQPSVCIQLYSITKLCRRQAEVIQNHENEHIRGIGKGEARHRKYKRPQFGGGQVYDRSSDYAAVVA